MYCLVGEDVLTCLDPLATFTTPAQNPHASPLPLGYLLIERNTPMSKVDLSKLLQTVRGKIGGLVFRCLPGAEDPNTGQI